MPRATEPNQPRTLADALRIAGGNPPENTERAYRVALVCGFTPLHLQTFLTAELLQRFPEHHIAISTGLYDDLTGTLGAVVRTPLDAILLVLEWADLDARLGVRRCGGWSPSVLPSVLDQVRTRLDHIEHLVREVAVDSPVVLCLPTLPLPPLFPTAGWQASAEESHLRSVLAQFGARSSSIPGVRVVNEQRLNEISPLGSRLDLRSLWTFGFPYRIQHTALLAAMLGAAAQSRPPRKGVITDLDNTLWAGVVGDDGPQNVSWDLEHHAQAHALYQQLLSSLADQGVLVGVASKNDPAVVDEVFSRPDLLLAKDQVFPIDASWESKAQAVERVLAAWNVHAESVLFVDDSPMELAEVKAAHPAIECLQFPSNPAEIVVLLERLRDEFGHATVTAEDRIRRESLRQSSATLPVGSVTSYSENVLEQSGAELTLTFSRDAADARALELVNKTNQFSLNGRRFTARSWSDYLREPGSFLLTASYTDRFGPLGKIGVVAGRVLADEMCVDVWVMSCRAFARRIEHQCLKALFDRWRLPAVKLTYIETERNSPFARFLASMQNAGSGLRPTVLAEEFRAMCPQLYHRVLLTDAMRDEVKDGVEEDERYARTSG